MTYQRTFELCEILHLIYEAFFLLRFKLDSSDLRCFFLLSHRIIYKCFQLTSNSDFLKTLGLHSATFKHNNRSAFQPNVFAYFITIERQEIQVFCVFSSSAKDCFLLFNDAYSVQSRDSARKVCFQ